jgi:hypothetical protein
VGLPGRRPVPAPGSADHRSASGTSDRGVDPEVRRRVPLGLHHADHPRLPDPLDLGVDASRPGAAAGPRGPGRHGPDSPLPRLHLPERGLRQVEHAIGSAPLSRRRNAGLVHAAVAGAHRRGAIRAARAVAGRAALAHGSPSAHAKEPGGAAQALPRHRARNPSPARAGLRRTQS